MKRFDRRFIAILLSLLMILSQMSLTAFALGEPVNQDPEQEVSGQTVGDPAQVDNETPGVGSETPGGETVTNDSDKTDSEVAEPSADTKGGGTMRLLGDGTENLPSTRTITVNNKTGNPILLVFKDIKDGAVIVDTYTVNGTSQLISLVSLDEVHTTGTAAIDKASGAVTATYKDSERSGYDHAIVLSGNVTAGGSIDIVPAWTVTFDPNGGSRGEMKPQLIKKGATASLDWNTYEKDGYTFEGWAKTSDATEAKYSDNGLLKPESDVTLYAVWGKYEHQHHWVTSVDQSTATVTIRCDAPGCPIEKDCVFKINTPDKVYDGYPYQEIEAEMISGKVPEGFDIPDDSDYPAAGIRYYDAEGNKLDGAPVNAGHYTLKASLMYKGSVEEIINCSFAITPAVLTVKADAQTRKYGEVDPEFTYSVKGLVRNDKKKDVLTGELTRTEGENVGSYVITRGTLDVSTGNYALRDSGFTGAEMTITKATAEVKVAPEAVANLVADGTDKALVTPGEAVGEDCKIVYALGEKGEFSNDIPVASEPDEYTVRYKAVAKKSAEKNYADSEEVSLKVTITPYGVTAPAKIEGLVYNGEAQTLVSPGTTNRGEMYYWIDSAPGWVKTLPSATAAGAHPVQWAVFTDGETDADHMLSNGTVDASIAKYQLTEDDITAPEAVDGLIYNGQKQTLVTAGSSDLATFEYKVGKDSYFNPDITAGAVGTEAGPYDVYYNVVPKDTVNYEGYVGEPVEASIGAQAVKAEWGNISLTYNGEPQAPSVTVKTYDGTTTLKPGADYNVTGQKTNATKLYDILTYRAAVEITNDNYTIAEGDYTYYIINPKPVGIKWEGGSYTYDGEAHQPTAFVDRYYVVGDDSCTVESDGITIKKDSKTVKTAVNAGTYVATVDSDGLSNGNYVPMEESASKEFTISKVKLDTAVEIEGWTYGEEPKSPSVTNNPEKSAVTYAYYKQVRNGDEITYVPVDDPTEVGIYVVAATIAESANYLETTVSNWFAIAKADTELSVSIEGWTYGGEPNLPEVDCNIEDAEIKIYYAGTANDGSEYSAWDTPPVKAGSYAVVAIVDETDDYSGAASAVAEFVIEKADPELTISADGWTYGDIVNPDKDFKISAKYENFNREKLTYYYYKDGVRTPISKGSFGTLDAGRVTIGVAYSDENEHNFTADTAECTVTISKADLPFSVVAENHTYHFDEDRHEADAYYLAGPDGVVPEGVTVKYWTKFLGEPSEDRPVGSAAGRYGIWYSIDGGGNYKSQNTGLNLLPDFYAEIAKADITGAQANITGWTYGEYSEKVNSPSTANLPSDYDKDNITYVYAPLEEGQAAESVDPASYDAEVPEDAGYYAVKALIGETDNYNASESMPAGFEIEKAELALSVSLDDWTYGEDPEAPVVEGNESGAEPTFWYWSDVEGKYPGSNTVPTDAGTYNVMASVPETDNYKAASSGSDTFTIGQADPFNGIYVEDWAYGEFKDRRNMPVFVDLPEEIAKSGITYKWTKIEDYTVEELIPEDFKGDWLSYDQLKTAFNGLGVGEYAVIARIPASTNYVGVDTDPVSFEVTTGEAEYDKEMLPKEATGLTYDGTDQVLFAPMSQQQLTYWLGEDSENELYWAVNTNPVWRPILPTSYTKMTSVDMPKGKDADTYYVWLKVVNPNRETSSVFLSLQVKIAKAKITTAEADISGWKYGEYDEDLNAPSVSGVPADYSKDNITFVYAPLKENQDPATVNPDKYTEDVPEDAGTYVVKALLGETDNYEASESAPKAFTIAKAKMNLTVAAAGWTYGDEAVDPVVGGNVSGKEATFKYSSVEEGKYPESDKAPVAAGTYKVKALVAESDNYEAAESAATTFEIKKADPFNGMYVHDWAYGSYKELRNMPKFVDLPEEIVEDNITYKWIPTEGLDIEEIKPSDFKGDWLTPAQLSTAFAALKVGEYAVIAKIPSSNNYAETVTGPVPFEVITGDSDYDERMLPKGITGLKYDGTDKGLFAPMTPEQFDYWLGDGSENELYWAITERSWTRPILPSSYTKMTANDMPKAKEVGTYYVWLKVVNPYRDTTRVFSPLKVEISKGELHLGLTMEGYTYGKAVSTPKLTGNAGNGKVTYLYEGKSLADKPYSSDKAPKDAGSYTVTATVAETDNYSGAVSAAASFTVSPATLKITARDKSKTYDGKPLVGDDYDFEGRVTGDVIWPGSVKGNSLTKAGSIDNLMTGGKMVRLAGLVDVTSNYEFEYVAGTLTVNKKGLTIATESDEKVYDGTPLTNKGRYVEGLVEADEISLDITGTQTNAGSSKNTVAVIEIRNDDLGNVTDCYDIDYILGDLEVTRKPIKITALSSTKEYDGTALDNNGYTYDPLANGDWISDVTVTGSQTEVGTSDNVASAASIKNRRGEPVSNNYDITYVKGKLTVKPKTLKIVAEDKSKTYGQADPELTYTSSGLLDGDRIIGELERDKGEATGSYAIRQGNLTAPDYYAISYKGATLTITADKTALNASIATAQSYYDSIKDAYPDVAAALWNVIQAAQKVAATANVSQTEVNNARFSTETAVKTASDNVAVIVATRASNAAAYTPAQVKLTKASKGSKKLTAKFKRINKNVAGYQVMATNMKTGQVKIVKVKQSKKSAKKIKKVVKGLAKKTRYNVQVRAYNVVGNETYFGAWSNVKSVTTR